MKLTFKSKLARDLTLALLAAASAINRIPSTMTRLLVGLVVAYLLLPMVSPIQPLPIREALGLIMGLPADKLLTAVGIFAGYVIAVETWRMQKRFELQMETAVEIDAFMQLAANEVLDLELFAGRMCALNSRLQDAVDVRDFQWEANELFSLAPTMVVTRSELRRKAVAIHALRARHEVVLQSTTFGSPAFDRAESALDRIVGRMWFFIPANAATPSDLARMVAQCDQMPLVSFCEVCERERRWLSVAGGAVRGGVLGRVVNPSIWTALRARKLVAGIAESDRS